MTELDILIPVYNEGENIVETLRSLEREVKTPFRALICYDFDGGNDTNWYEMGSNLVLF